MKQSYTLALTVVTVVAIGIAGISISAGDIFGLENDPKLATQADTSITGHVIVKHMDSEGNVKSYQQTDNVVTFVGKNCAANKVFGSGFGNCTSSDTFRYIGVSTNTGATFADETASLTNECTGGSPCGSINARATGTVSAFTAGANDVNPVAQIQATFQNTGSSTTLASAGLFDAATSGNMFALRGFASTTLNTNDSIQVTWQIGLNAPFT